MAGSTKASRPLSPAALDRNANAAYAGHAVLTIAVGLVSLGLLMVYSTSSVKSAFSDSHTQVYTLSRQLQWVFIAIVAGGIAAWAPTSLLRAIAKPAMLISLALLAATLLFAPERNKAKRWLYIAGISVQASEFFKIAVLLFLADRLSRRERAQSFGDSMPFAPVLLPLGVGVVLVLLAPDLGMSLFLVAEIVVLLGLGGVRPTRFVPLLLTSLPLIVFYAYTRFGHVRKRIELFSNNEGNSQVREALIAMGSGGLMGVGLGEGKQKLGYIAEAHTDFIFAVIGEELGFLGCAGVVLAFMAFIWYGRKVAWHAREVGGDGSHGFYLAAGATFIVCFQALINIAVVTATAPTKGVSLPFISVGGSNLVVACTCVGLIVNVSRRSVRRGRR